MLSHYWKYQKNYFCSFSTYITQNSKPCFKPFDQTRSLKKIDCTLVYTWLNFSLLPVSCKIQIFANFLTLLLWHFRAFCNLLKSHPTTESLWSLLQSEIHCSWEEPEGNVNAEADVDFVNFLHQQDSLFIKFYPRKTRKSRHFRQNLRIQAF